MDARSGRVHMKRTRRVVSAALACAAVMTAPAEAATPSVRHLWANTDWSSAFNFSVDSAKTDVFVAHDANSYAVADSFHRYNPGGRAYFYADFGVAGARVASPACSTRRPSRPTA